MPMMMRQKGLGLVELMIGLVVGMIVVGAAMQLMLSSVTSSGSNIKMARLEQDLRQTMQMVSRDLRRAAFWDAAVDVAQVALAAPINLSGNTGTVVVSSASGALANIGIKARGGVLIHVDGSGNAHRGTITDYNNGTYTVSLAGTWPAAVATKSINPGSWNILPPQSVVTTASGNCVLFVADMNLDGEYSSNEHFGYRYNSTDKTVQVRYSGANTDTCASGGVWESLTNANLVEITDFSVGGGAVDTSTASGLVVSIREYTITIAGRLRADPAVSRTVQETIRVRNDRVY